MYNCETTRLTIYVYYFPFEFKVDTCGFHHALLCGHALDDDEFNLQLSGGEWQHLMEVHQNNPTYYCKYSRVMRKVTRRRT